MKRTYKKFILVLLCLLMAGNLAQGIVLCLGADGHVELGSALHERCCATVHFPSSGGSLAFYESSHEKGEHCGGCVDIPISIGLAKILRKAKQSECTFAVPAVNVIAAVDQLNISANNPASNSFAGISYFMPLRTVILLV